MRTLNVALVLASIAVAPFVSAAEGADTERGHAYAKKVCAKCHAVEGGDMISPTMIAPTFTAIADTPGMNERALIVWFQSSDHETMPYSHTRAGRPRRCGCIHRELTDAKVGSSTGTSGKSSGRFSPRRPLGIGLLIFGAVCTLRPTRSGCDHRPAPLQLRIDHV